MHKYEVIYEPHNNQKPKPYCKYTKENKKRFLGRWQVDGSWAHLIQRHTERTTFRPLILKMTNFASGRTSKANRRKKATSQRIGRVEMWLGTKSLAPLTTNGRDIKSMENWEDHTPQHWVPVLRRWVPLMAGLKRQWGLKISMFNSWRAKGRQEIESTHLKSKNTKQFGLRHKPKAVIWRVPGEIHEDLLS